MNFDRKVRVFTDKLVCLEHVGLKNERTIFYNENIELSIILNFNQTLYYATFLSHGRQPEVNSCMLKLPIYLLLPGGGSTMIFVSGLNEWSDSFAVA